MSPEDELAFEKLSKAEKVIKALETLATECVGEGLDSFADRLKDCVSLCQSDYVALQRKQYQERDRKSGKPGGTKH